MTTIHTGSPERRAEVVAGIRALADLIENDTTLPVPNAVSAQFSLGDLDEAGRQFIRDTADHLDIDPQTEGWEETHRADREDYATAVLGVAKGYTPADGTYSVRYVVHGRRRAGEQA